MTLANPFSDGPQPHQGAYDTVRSFIYAIVWGEHHSVWELLAPAAREHVFAAATRKGMDAVAVARARQGTWSIEEADEFLTSLIRGLRVDLSGVDLDQIEVINEPELQTDGTIRFRLESKTVLPAELTGGANWAAGAVIVTLTVPSAETVESSMWRVKTLVPRPPAGPGL